VLDADSGNVAIFILHHSNLFKALTDELNFAKSAFKYHIRTQVLRKYNAVFGLFWGLFLRMNI